MTAQGSAAGGEIEAGAAAAARAGETVVEPAGAPPRSAARETVVPRGFTWRGEVAAAESLRIAGIVEGTIESSAPVIVERSGRVRGRISAARVRVAGEVDGDVAAASLIWVEATGMVLGNVEARRVTLVSGARVGGEVRSLESDEEPR